MPQTQHTPHLHTSDIIDPPKNNTPRYLNHSMLQTNPKKDDSSSIYKSTLLPPSDPLKYKQYINTRLGQKTAEPAPPKKQSQKYDVSYNSNSLQKEFSQLRNNFNRLHASPAPTSKHSSHIQAKSVQQSPPTPPDPKYTRNNYPPGMQPQSLPMQDSYRRSQKYSSNRTPMQQEYASCYQNMQSPRQWKESYRPEEPHSTANFKHEQQFYNAPADRSSPRHREYTPKYDHFRDSQRHFKQQQQYVQRPEFDSSKQYNHQFSREGPYPNTPVDHSNYRAARQSKSPYYRKTSKDMLSFKCQPRYSRPQFYQNYNKSPDFYRTEESRADARSPRLNIRKPFRPEYQYSRRDQYIRTRYCDRLNSPLRYKQLGNFDYGRLRMFSLDRF